MKKAPRQRQGGKNCSRGAQDSHHGAFESEQKRNPEGEITSAIHAKKSRRSSLDVVEYPKQKQELERNHRKEEMQLRREELEASVKQQRQRNDMMKKFTEQQHQQTQMLSSLLVQKKYITRTINLRNIPVTLYC